MTESSNDIPEKATAVTSTITTVDVAADSAAATSQSGDAPRTADGRLVGDVNGDGVVDIDDRRLPLIARIYGIILLIQGALTIPPIVLAVLYTVREAIAGRLDVGTVNLTAILSGLSAVNSSVAFITLAIFGVLLIRNRRKHAARWINLLIVLTIGETLFTTALDGFGWNHLGPLIQLAILVALSVTVDPDLRAERRRETAARRREDRAAYEKALGMGMPGRDLTGKGYISLDFFNIFWLFMVGCVVGLIIETIYHFVLFGEYQDRAGLLWGPFSPIYGCGVVILTALLNRLWRQNWLLIFCASAVIGGTFEYLVSWFMEVAFGITAWDYTGKWLSIDGRTSGKYMFFWGVLGLAWIKLILPRLLALIQRIPWRVRYALTLACLAFMVVDAAMTLMALDAWYSRLAGIEADSPVARFFGTYFDDAFMANRFQTMHIDPAKAGRM